MILLIIVILISTLGGTVFTKPTKQQQIIAPPENFSAAPIMNMMRTVQEEMPYAKNLMKKQNSEIDYFVQPFVQDSLFGTFGEVEEEIEEFVYPVFGSQMRRK